MKPGIKTACPECYTIHTYGARLGVEKDKQRFCSVSCEIKAAERIVQRERGSGLAHLLSQTVVTRTAQLLTVWCNSCVEARQWCPVLDGSECPACGCHLSLYGPFEEPPSLFHVPQQQDRRWRFC